MLSVVHDLSTGCFASSDATVAPSDVSSAVMACSNGATSLAFKLNPSPSTRTISAASFADEENGTEADVRSDRFLGVGLTPDRGQYLNVKTNSSSDSFSNETNVSASTHSDHSSRL